MSADNTIIVLGTWKGRESTGNDYEFHAPKKVYRVSHVGAWDKFKWYQQNQPENIGAYLAATFSANLRYNNLQDAMYVANTYLKMIGYVEYGIQVVETNYTFFGD